MPPRLKLLSSPQILVFRPKVKHCSECFTRQISPPFAVKFSTKNDLPTSSDGKVPNTDTLPSINEEAEALNKIRGEEPPDLEVGTPVQEVLKRDTDALENAPKDIKDALKKINGTGKRSFSTTSSQRVELINIPDDSSDILMAKTLPILPEEWEAEPLPPLKPEDTLVGRYPAILEQFSGLIMRHGKKGVAQQNIARVLSHLRTAPPPKPRADRPLIVGAPHPSHLPLNPVHYLTVAIDSIAPLVRIKQLKGAAGGGQSLPVPMPLAVRQRRRAAFMWIIEAAGKRQNRGTGRGTFAHRLAEEIVAVVEGRSALWERRTSLHRVAVAARSNVNMKRRMKRKV